MCLVATIWDSAGLDLCHMTTPSASKAGKCGFGAEHIATSHKTAILNKEKQTKVNLG